MDKTVFNNKTFHILILIGLGVLISYNLYVFSISLNVIALIPVCFQLVVLGLVLKKHKRAKLGIKIWSILLIVGPLMTILGKTIRLLLGDDMSSELMDLVGSVFILLIGLAIFQFNSSTVEVQQINLEKKKEGI